MFSDFYPTPYKCLEHTKDIIQNSRLMLEGTAGLGSITAWASDYISPKQIIANELSPKLSSILKELQPNIKVMTENFITKKYDTWNKDIDTIYLNPPFTNQGDKKFYIDFLFQAIAILNHNKGNSQRLHNLVFISPRLTDKIKQTQKENQVIVMDYIVDKIPLKKLQSVVKNITGEQVKSKEEFIETLQDDLFYTTQIQFIATCEGFGGTKIRADIYNFII